MARQPKLKPQADRDLSEEAIRAANKLVKFDTRDYEVEQLVNKFNLGEYYVPEYQRNFTWQDKQKSRFIESVLIGLPIPFIFFWQDNEGKFEIVDGSQRIRTLKEFLENEHKLGDLEILEELKGFKFRDLLEGRQRKVKTRVIRGILLENDTTAETRTEMFSRINTGGTKANAAEVRRGSLPGPVMDLIVEMSTLPKFIQMTPLSDAVIKRREREEFAARFFAYTDSYQSGIDGGNMFEGYRDRPADFIYNSVKSANVRSIDDPLIIQNARTRFIEMLDFVDRVFPNGFQKPNAVRQVPRARYEAIAIGSSIALREQPALAEAQLDISDWINSDEFVTATTSDGANGRSMLEGRINFVRHNLIASFQ